jgi:formylglycine-generating enzyme
MIIRAILIILFSGCIFKVGAQGVPPQGMVHIPGGTFVPLYGDSSKIRVKSFYMDQYPVTNVEYVAFVEKYPQWSKGGVKKLFADQGYLRHWNEEMNGNEIPQTIVKGPVVNVSWFAAKAYCECQGKRLPTVEEWEFAALASEAKPNASNDEVFYQRILEWYSKPNPKIWPQVDSSFKNYYGLYGMIGLVWEWTLDFNSALLQGESRANAGFDRQLFCGAGASSAKDVKNYVAFMRYAFRSSLKANYTVGNLGFRCVKEVDTL